MAGDDDADRPLTAADLRPLTEGLDALRQRFDDLDDADTPAERRRARADVEDAEEDLEAMAKRLGIPQKTLAASIAAARNAERKEELRPILQELLDEAKAAADAGADPPDPDPDPDADADADPDAGDAGDTGGTGRADRPAPTRARRQPAPDSEPVREHWMERGIGTLLK